jgi:hypothetical protein
MHPPSAQSKSDDKSDDRGVDADRLLAWVEAF